MQVRGKDYRVPLDEPKPDAGRFIRVLRGQEKADRPPAVEYLVDPVVMEPVLESMGRKWVGYDPASRAAQEAYLDNYVEFWYRMGYDFVRFEQGFQFGEYKLTAKDTATAASGDRFWQNEHSGPIMSWQDFELFPWPSADEFDFFPFEYLDSHLPDGMGLIAAHEGGICEHLSWMMSYEGLCLALYDNPGLAEAVDSWQLAIEKALSKSAAAGPTPGG